MVSAMLGAMRIDLAGCFGARIVDRQCDVIIEAAVGKAHAAAKVATDTVDALSCGQRCRETLSAQRDRAHQTAAGLQAYVLAAGTCLRLFYNDVERVAKWP